MEDKKDLDEKQKTKLSSIKDKNEPDEPGKEKELALKMKKQLSPARAVLRIIIGLFALVIWILIGVPSTLVFSSGIQSFIGVVSFFNRNPIAFLLVALFNIFMGLISFIILGIWWWAAFHILWSIRWFYGYVKYSRIKKSTI